MYHNFSGPGKTSAGAVTVNALREQLTYLRDHFHIVPLACIPQRLNEGRPFDNFTVALTVDDGRRNFYEFLFPLLQEFAMPATFFVVSSFIRGEDWVWTDKVLWLSDQPSAPHELSPGEIANLFGLLNRMRPEIRNAHIETIAARMGVTLPHEAPREYAPCTWSELREMADSGLVEIGSHSATHPILSSITDEEAWRELTVSRSQIEEGDKLVPFVFPTESPGTIAPAKCDRSWMPDTVVQLSQAPDWS